MKFQTIDELAANLKVSESEAMTILKQGGLSLDDIDGVILEAIRDDLKGAIAIEIQKSSSQIAPTSTQLTEVRSRTNTNSSIKKSAKKEGAIATSKRGSSKVAKSGPVEKAQIEKASTRALIKDLEVGAIEEAGRAGYNSDVGSLAAVAYLQGVQMRVADDLAINMPQAMNGIFGSIGEVSDTRYQGIFDHPFSNEPSQKVEIDWST